MLSNPQLRIDFYFYYKLLFYNLINNILDLNEVIGMGRFDFFINMSLVFQVFVELNRILCVKIKSF